VASVTGRARAALVVDARVLTGSGIGRYVRALVPRLAARVDFDEVILAGDPAELDGFVASEVPGARVVALLGGRYSIKSQLGWALIRAQMPANAVYWFPHWDAPAWLPEVRSVVTVHDLIHLRVQGSAGLVEQAGMRWLLRRVTERAQRVICVSEHTRRDLEQLLPKLAGRTRVVLNGVDARFLGASAAPLPAAVRSPYLLCVANRKPHKNLEMAVRALARLADTALQLVVAGEGGTHWSRVMQVAEQFGVAARVVDVGVVDDVVLHALYQHAECLLAPSRYEGFGLPVLEAMACGTPVVAARTTSIPEVAGDAARLVDDDDDEAMAREVTALRTSAEFRAMCIEAGRKRAATFTWERSAAETAAVLLEAVQ
jgi:glycosyltransferase involved in cell wall biosynthesis